MSNETEKEKLCLFKFHEDFGRMGSLDGIFCETQSRIDKVMGKTVHFGEVLGKHSNISCRLTTDNITKVDVEENVIEAFCSLNLAAGTNPLEYMYDQEEYA